MPWLLRDGQVLASAELATTRAQRRRGLLGRDGIDGALVIRPARSVHTVGMRFALDVAHLGPDGTVLRTTAMARNRIGRPVWAARSVLEAPSGAFARWNLAVGDVLEIRTAEP